MGKYSDPAMFVNKQYEQLNKGLSDMYSNVAKNAQAIKARELKKKQQAAKRMSDWNKIYAKGTQENYQGALDFTSAMPEDSVNTMQFTNQLKSVYKQGYDNIAQMVASGASEGEIASYVQDQINAANTFTEGIVAFDNFQQKYNSGIEKIGQEAGDMKGNEVGDIVVGSQYNNTFSALGIDPGDDKVPLDQLKMVGDLNTGIKFFYDKDGDGKLQEAEVLDLNTMAKNFSGGENPYFKEVEDFTEISKAYRSQLANLEKAPDFVKEMSVTDANGVTRKVTHVDRKKRQDYFLNENSDGGKLINEIIRTKDVTMLAQSIYGYKFAEQFDPTDPVQMKMLKVGLAEKLSPSLFPGSEKLAPSASDRTTVTRTYEDKSPEIAIIENFTKPVHEDISSFRTNPSAQAATKLNNDFRGRPFKTSKGGKLVTGVIDSVTQVGGATSNKIEVSYTPDGTNFVEIPFDLTKDEDAALFESMIVHGNFPNAKKERIDGVAAGLVSGKGYDDSKSTTRITKRQGSPTLKIEDFEEQISGSNDVISSRDLYESWKQGFEGPEIETTTISAKPTGVRGTEPTPGTMGTETISYSDLSSTSFGGKDYSSNTRVGQEGKYDSQDPLDNQIMKIINFETIAGSSSGKGVSSYGFTDDKYTTKPQNPKEAVEMVKTEIMPATMKELKIPAGVFEDIDPMIQASLIDYKMNTGRNMADLLVIAYENENNIPDDKRTWDGIKGAGSGSPTVTQEMRQALADGKISAAAIAAAKDELYVGRLVEMKKNKSPKYDEALEAYQKSHSNRVNMFK